MYCSLCYKYYAGCCYERQEGVDEERHYFVSFRLNLVGERGRVINWFTPISRRATMVSSLKSCAKTKTCGRIVAGRMRCIACEPFINIRISSVRSISKRFASHSENSSSRVETSQIVVEQLAATPRSKARNSPFEEWIMILFIRLTNLPKACQKFFWLVGAQEN